MSPSRRSRPYAASSRMVFMPSCPSRCVLSSDGELCKKLGRNGYSCADKYGIENSLAEMAEIYGKYVDIPTSKTETEVLSGENR